MAKKSQPFVLSDNWYRNPTACMARVTTEQWKQMLLDERDSFMALGHLWQLRATRVGPGVYEIRAEEKALRKIT